MSTLVSALITTAFLDLGIMPVGFSVSTDAQTDAFARLNQLLLNWSDEGAMVFNQVRQTFSLVAATSAYTLGSGGTFVTTSSLRAQKVTDWRATSGDMQKGGPALSLSEFDTAAMAGQAKLAELFTRAALKGAIASVPSTLTVPIPSIVGADTAYPLINVRVWPPPSASPGTIELGYWTPIAAFSTVGDSIALPPGYEDALHFNLAVALAPMWLKGAPIPEALAANAASTKARIVQQNTVMTQQAKATSDAK